MYYIILHVIIQQSRNEKYIFTFGTDFLPKIRGFSKTSGAEASLILAGHIFAGGSMVRAMRFFFSSTSTTQTFTMSPTFTTSEG